MIKITIEQTITDEVEETENFVIKRTPTEITEEERSTYSGTTKKVKFIEESEPRTVKKQRSRSITLLQQQIEDDSAFDFKAVIATINSIQRNGG